MEDFDKSYWEDLDVNCEYIIDDWEGHYNNKLEKFLAKLDEATLFDLCEMLETIPPTYNKEDIKKVLVFQIKNSTKSPLLGLLLNFHLYKAELIRDYFAQLCKEGKLKKINLSNTFSKLVHIYLTDKNELKNILIQHYWVRTVSFSQKYIPSIPFREEFIQDFEKKMHIFITNMEKRNWKNLSYRYFGKIKTNEGIIYSIVRQTGDKLIRNIDKNKRNKLANDLLLSYNFTHNFLEIRCKDKQVIKKTLKVLESLVRIYFSPQISINKDFRESVFIGALESLNSFEDGNIIGISFKKSRIDGSVPLSVLPSHNIDSITTSIIDLRDRKIVDLKLDNISSIIIKFKEKFREIQLLEKRPFLFFTLQKNMKINDYELNKLYETFRANFGLGLEERFSLEDRQINKEEQINKIMGGGKLIISDSVEEEILKNLDKMGIISINYNLIYHCVNCRRINKKGSICPHCDSNTRLIKSTINAVPIRDNIIDYVISQITDSSLNLVTKKSRRTWHRPYEFVKLSYHINPVYIYLCFENLSAHLISFFQRSSLPIIILNMGNSPNDDIISLTNFEQIQFAKIFLGEVSPKEFTDIIKKRVEQTNIDIVTSANISHKKLKDMKNYDYNQFEDDCFNLLKYVFREAEKWGKEKKGIEIPEGICEIRFNTKMGESTRTFSWDCKYAYGSDYHLNINEKRKAESYIRKLMSSKEIKDSSRDLNSYLLISNSITDDQFRKFAEYVIGKIRSWKGNIVLFELSALIGLFELYNKHYNTLIKRHNDFYRNIAKLFLEKKKNRFFRVTQWEIEVLFSSIVKS